MFKVTHHGQRLQTWRSSLNASCFSLFLLFSKQNFPQRSLVWYNTSHMYFFLQALTCLSEAPEGRAVLLEHVRKVGPIFYIELQEKERLWKREWKGKRRNLIKAFENNTTHFRPNMYFSLIILQWCHLNARFWISTVGVGYYVAHDSTWPLRNNHVFAKSFLNQPLNIRQPTCSKLLKLAMIDKMLHDRST